MKHIAIALALVSAVPLSGCVTPRTAEISSVEKAVGSTLLGLDALYHLAADKVIAMPAGPAKERYKAIGSAAGTALLAAHQMYETGSPSLGDALATATASINAFAATMGVKPATGV